MPHTCSYERGGQKALRFHMPDAETQVCNWCSNIPLRSLLSLGDDNIMKIKLLRSGLQKGYRTLVVFNDAFCAVCKAHLISAQCVDWALPTDHSVSVLPLLPLLVGWDQIARWCCYGCD